MNRVKNEMKGIQERLAKLNTQLIEAQKKEVKFAEQWKKLLHYSTLYEYASIEQKRQIVSKVVKRVTVGRGYEIDIELRIGVDVLEEGVVDDTQEVRKETTA